MIEPMPAMKKSAVHGGIGHVFSKLTSEIGDPVDFELPDWLNKWQPTPFTYIKRNIYLTKKVKRRLEDDGIFCSCSSTAGSSDVCGRDCLCRWLEFSDFQFRRIFFDREMHEGDLFLAKDAFCEDKSGDGRCIVLGF